jgi:hypothetical protein
MSAKIINRMPDIQKIEAWKKSLNGITDDITELVLNKYFYTELANNIQTNPKINTGNHFWNFLKENYIAAMVLGICRQVDTDERSESLLRLLNELFDDAETLTKAWYVSQYSSAPINLGAGDFERHFGSQNFVDPSIIYSDIGKLLFATKEIKKFRHKRIAHKNKNDKLKFSLTFDSLHETINVIEAIAVKYNLLLNQTGYPDNSLLPVIQYDWEDIFNHPWSSAE